MGQADFPRARLGATTDQRGAAGSVVRRAERPGTDDIINYFTGQAVDFGNG